MNPVDLSRGVAIGLMGLLGGGAIVALLDQPTAETAPPTTTTTTYRGWEQSGVVIVHGNRQLRCAWVRFQPDHVVDLGQCEEEGA